nr:hypothetical protein [Pseudobutyrivibrio sp.]
PAVPEVSIPVQQVTPVEPIAPELEAEPQVEEPEFTAPEPLQEIEEPELTIPEVEIPVMDELVEPQVEELTELPEEIYDEAAEVEEAPMPQVSFDDIVLPEIQLPPDIFEEEPTVSEAEPVVPEVAPVQVERVQIEEPMVDTQVAAPTRAALEASKPQSELNLEDEDLEVFSYFLPINGMKANIIRVIEGAASYINKPQANGGCIAIVGESGSGKTQMATSIIKVLQKKTGFPKGGIGKISGEKLNEKDIQKLYSKIQSGCLIIESAGGISKETALTLSLLMESDNTGTIIIIEDSKKGIDKALIKDSSFAKRFTEKVVIPVFSIDELVSFAKTYALEAGCTIDDMGILALYNRINLIGRYDHVTTIKEVAEIMDDAIEKSTKGGFFNKPKYDKYGNVILKEKDFDK